MLGDAPVQAAPATDTSLPAPVAPSLLETLGPILLLVGGGCAFGAAGFYSGRWAARKVEKWLF